MSSPIGAFLRCFSFCTLKIVHDTYSSIKCSSGPTQVKNNAYCFQISEDLFLPANNSNSVAAVKALTYGRPAACYVSCSFLGVYER